MSYHTDFSGTIRITPRLPDAWVDARNADPEGEYVDELAGMWVFVQQDDATEIMWEAFGGSHHEADTWLGNHLADLPSGHTANGLVEAQGEDPQDRWALQVVDGTMRLLEGRASYTTVPPRPQVDATAATHTFLVTVKADTWEQALTVMSARMDHDEVIDPDDGGPFDYQLSWVPLGDTPAAQT